MAAYTKMSLDRKGRIDAYVVMLNEKYGGGYYQEEGNRYIRIVKGASVHTFVDKYNGNILKAATWKAPAPNGVRGSVYSDDHGLSVVNEHGAIYLK
jgi:hypothetical protein